MRSEAGKWVWALGLGWCVALSAAWGDVIFDLVTIGDVGNPWDLVWEGNPDVPDDDIWRGKVDYEYQITKYEVTVAQYVEFLNWKAKSDPYGLWNENMADPILEGGAYILRGGEEGSYVYTAVEGKENQPVRYVSFYDAVRFANWMHNGQGEGDTEYGAYDLSQGRYLVRLSGARWALPSEDEWHKAAYYDGGVGKYWQYPNGRDETEEPEDQTTPRELNFGWTPFWQGSVVFTSVGETTGRSAYGVCDMGGNVEEWTESLVPPQHGWNRIVRGGAFSSSAWYLSRAGIISDDPTVESVGHGFRLVYLIPEPGVVGLVVLGAGVLLLSGRFRR